MSKMLEHESIHLCFPDMIIALCQSAVVSRINLVNRRAMKEEMHFFKRTNREYIQNYYCEKCLQHLQVYMLALERQKEYLGI